MTHTLHPLLTRAHLPAALGLLFAMDALALAESPDFHGLTRSEGAMKASAAGTHATAAVSVASRPAERMREGTKLIDETGTFQSIGDRIAFLPGGSKDAYCVLENLMLQRIGQELDEGRGQWQWRICGVVTEYRGANYLLVTKAVVRRHDDEPRAPR